MPHDPLVTSTRGTHVHPAPNFRSRSRGFVGSPERTNRLDHSRPWRGGGASLFRLLGTLRESSSWSTSWDPCLSSWKPPLERPPTSELENVPSETSVSFFW